MASIEKFIEPQESFFTDTGNVLVGKDGGAYSRCHQMNLSEVALWQIINDGNIERIGRVWICLYTGYDEQRRRSVECFRPHPRYKNSLKTLWGLVNLPGKFTQETWDAIKAVGPVAYDRGFGFYCEMGMDGKIVPWVRQMQMTRPQIAIKPFMGKTVTIEDERAKDGWQPPELEDVPF